MLTSMTLVSRNRLFLLLFVLAVAFIITTTGIFIMSLTKGGILVPQNSQPLFHIPQVPLLAVNFFAAVLSAMVLTLYSPVVLGIALVNFEKTRSPEIIFFSLFAFGCLFEGIRIWLLVLDLWANNSLYIFVGRLLFFGRALAVVNLVALALLSLELENKQNIEMNLLIVVSLAALLARLMPIDTLVIPSSYSIRFGYEKMFLMVAAVTTAAGFLAMLHQGHNLDSREYLRVSLGFLLLSYGYLLLTQSDCLLALSVGTILITAGSGIFLLNLHRFHKWK